MADLLSDFLTQANTFLWGWFMIIILLGCHVFMTFRTGFIQRYVGKGIRLSFKKSKDGHPGDVSHFSSLMIALAATIGVGNIVGVATAITLGGAGAVFWCWVTGIFGIATKYGEAVLAVKYRSVTPKGTYLGGPMYALRNGVKSKFLAGAFCVFTVLASFGIGNMTQANSFADVLSKSVNIPTWITGLVAAVLVAVVVIGGVKSIAAVCSKLVPIMAMLYIIGCLLVLWANGEFVLPAVSLIVKSAFEPTAVGGGLLGGGFMMAVRYGVARGLFSNESGMGSAPIAAAAAKTKTPAEQGLVSMTGTFWDTVVVCALTGTVVVSSMLKAPELFSDLKGAQIAYLAFGNIPLGKAFIVVGLVCFAFSTLLGWSYYGERCLEYLTGGKGIIFYRIVWVLLVYVGATQTLEMVWNFSDIFNALMVIPNVIALIWLSRVIRNETKIVGKL